MTTVTAPERHSAISKVDKRSDLTPAGRHDFGLPSNICVTHGNRPAAMLAPSVGLQIRQIRIPGDVNPGGGIAGRSQEGADLHLVTLEQHDLN